MKRILKIVFTIILMLPVAFIILNTINIKVNMYRLGKADHAQILSACREVIHNRNTYHNDRECWSWLHEGDVLILKPLPPEIPAELQKLKPHHLLIKENQIIVNMSLPFYRSAYLAFSENQHEYGTFKYIDGLWFWSGDFESEDMKNRV